MVGDDEPDEDIAELVGRLGGALRLRRRPHPREGAPRRAAAIAESLGSARVVASVFNSRAILAGMSARPARAPRVPRAGARDRTRARPRAARDDLLQPLRRRVLPRPLRERTRPPGSGARGRAATRLAGVGVVDVRRDDVPALHARALGRGPRDRRGGPRGPAAGRAHPEPARVDHADPDPARRSWLPRGSLLSLYPETSADVQERPSVRVAARRRSARRGATRGGARGRARVRSSRSPGRPTPRRSGSSKGSRASCMPSRRRSRSAGREQAGELVARVERISPGIRPPLPRRAGPPAFGGASKATRRARRRDRGLRRATACRSGRRSSRLEHAELLGPGEERERLLGAARGEFERLGALPWLERVDAARPAVAL